MSDIVENMVEDAVEPKPGKNKASNEASDVGVGSGVASGDVKPTKQVEFHKTCSVTTLHFMLLLLSAMNVS